MQIARWMRMLPLLCLCSSAAVTCKEAMADTWTVYTAAAGGSGSVSNTGLTDNGTLTVFHTPNYYETFSPFAAPVISPTLPSLTFDNGSSCAPSFAGLSGVSQGKCNNGYDVFAAYASQSSTFQNLYMLEGTELTLLFHGPVIGLLVDAKGDVGFIDPLREVNYLAYDNTSARAAVAISPEPSSIVLAMSGLSAIAMRLRRRKLAGSCSA